MKRYLSGAALCAFWISFGHGALADISTEELVAAYQAEGFTFVEVRTGPTQVRVEAIRGADEIEVVYDRETGAILYSDVSRADDDDIGRIGVEFSSRDEDFRDDDDDDDDDDDNGGRGGDDDDDDDDDDDNGSDDD